MFFGIGKMVTVAAKIIYIEKKTVS